MKETFFNIQNWRSETLSLCILGHVLKHKDIFVIYENYPWNLKFSKNFNICTSTTSSSIPNYSRAYVHITFFECTWRPLSPSPIELWIPCIHQSKYRKTLFPSPIFGKYVVYWNFDSLLYKSSTMRMYEKSLRIFRFVQTWRRYVPASKMRSNFLK